MYEQDYIMRLIKEMVRTVLKLIFHVDMRSSMEELPEDLEVKTTLDVLLDMVDEGKINEAENIVYEITENVEHRYLEAALLFYFCLNEKTDEFLEENNFSRDEVKEGLMEIISRYGLGSMADTFLK